VLKENGAKARLATRGQQGIVYTAEITRRARTARIKPEASDGRPSLPRTCNVRAAKAASAVHVHDDVHAAIVEACRERAISRSSATTAN
jgi:hypothetical protein